MLYFDTSFLTPAFRKETTSAAVQQFLLGRTPGELAISDWVRIEFSSVLARDVRMGALESQTAIEIDQEFETTIAKSFQVILPDRDDFDLSKIYLQRFDTGLRAGDAMHLAIAHNHGAKKIYSLDKKLLRAGRSLDLPVTSESHGRD
jgi:predicted nucleic acid-binding protein